MPYIAKERRSALAHGDSPKTAGELNFVITDKVMSYVKAQGLISYATLNEVLGVLEAAKQEFYRRVVAPHEEEKCKENGDVYE